MCPDVPSAEPAELPRPRQVPPVPVDRIARALGVDLAGPEGSAAADVPVTGVTLDSRAVLPGDLWCALPGARAHGAEFAAQAAGLGAVAALTDADGTARCLEAGLAVLTSAHPRRDTATAAAIVLDRPAEALTTIGVTGTNGKTSVTTMIHETLQDLGVPTGLIGTGGTTYRDAHGADHRIATVRTTPESPEVQGILARMREDAVRAVSMEVSSHALVLHRADAIVFDAACFTNLSQDHLDFHGDMEHYFRAKATLFTPEHARRGIVCVDDAWGRRLAEGADLEITTYATDPEVDADWHARDIVPGGDGAIGSTFRLVSRTGESHDLTSPLPGRHYVANTVAVALLLEATGLPIDTTAPAIARSAVVPGRMEQVAAAPVRGVVDYSHTEAALAQALATLRALPGAGRLLVVMGAGGDRDRGKRPHMGAAAALGADVVLVTDDNPRSEDPATIRAAVLAGVPEDADADVREIPGRAAAIDTAARLARDGDVILVAGKGAETGQDIGGVIHPFDDRTLLREALARAAQEGR